MLTKPATTRSTRSVEVFLVRRGAGEAAEIPCDLQERGYWIRMERTGTRGHDTVYLAEWNVVIVDRAQPDLDSQSLVEDLGTKYFSGPILILSGLDTAGGR